MDNNVFDTKCGVQNISLLTGLFHPAFFLNIPRNYAFDIIAIQHRKKPAGLKIKSVHGTLWWAIRDKFLRRLFHI